LAPRPHTTLGVGDWQQREQPRIFDFVYERGRVSIEGVTDEPEEEEARYDADV
jgi:hypothetical protein